MSEPDIKFSHRLEALGYDALTGLMRLSSFERMSGLGASILRRIGPITSKQKIARTNLTIAFPDLSEAERDKLLAEQWENTGRTFAEFPLTDRLQAHASDGLIDVEGLEIFYEHAPAILISGHFANWEVMAAVLTQSREPVRVTYRKINNPLIDARVREQREAYGTKFLVQKSTHRGGRELFEALRGGESIALLVDQKFNTGLKLPFFGEDAMCPPGAVRLAMKTKRPLLPMVVVREGPRFKVKFYPPIEWERSGDRETDVRTGVMAVNSWLEDRIRENPAQWFWVHRRWPKEVYHR